jgi:AI-2 transport protein TqsA
LLSVPLTMIVKIALESSPDTRWVALLLASDSDEPVIQEAEVLAEDKEP